MPGARELEHLLEGLFTREFAFLRTQRDEDRTENTRRHTENIERLERIEDKVNVTNGRVTRHDEQIKAIVRWGALGAGAAGGAAAIGLLRLMKIL